MSGKGHAAICAKLHTNTYKHRLLYSLSTSDLAAIIHTENCKGVNACAI